MKRTARFGPGKGDGGDVTTIGIISAYPDEDWDAQQIERAARARGEVELLSPSDFGARVGDAGSLVTVRGVDARKWDLLLTPRALGERGDAELQLELYRTLARAGSLLVNDVRGLENAVDKFRSSWLLQEAGVPTPPAIVTQRLDEAEAALDEHRALVVKPLYGSLGIGVERVGRGDRRRLAALLADKGGLYLQAFVARARLDVRAFVVGGRVAAAVARRPRVGDFRANLRQGGVAEPHALDRASGQVAVRAAAALGLDYAGVDLLVTDEGPLVLEVNGTPSFRGLQLATGRDMAALIVDHALSVRKGDAESIQAEAEGRHERARGGQARRRARRPDHQGALRHALLPRDRAQGRRDRPRGARA